MRNPETVVVATRIPKPFAKIIKEYMLRDAYVSLADLLRDALREKIRRDAPQLYGELLEEGSDERLKRFFSKLEGSSR